MFIDARSTEEWYDDPGVARGHFGSYPNFIFGSHGIRRTNARFWETVDWLHADLKSPEPIQAGLYDFGRYQQL